MDPPQPQSSARSSKKGKGPREPPSREVKISKKLSWLLRHGATSENLPLDPSGYAPLNLVLSNRKLAGMKITFPEVQDVVASNEKQRFGMKLREGADPGSEKAGDWLIRANQGHSVKGLESEGLLEKVEGVREGECVVHGTSRGAWVAIVESGGLMTMGRNHIHFASGLPATFDPLATSSAPADGDKMTSPETAAPPVISGMRTSSTILIYLDLPKARAAGIKFWRSENGVILSEGDSEGKIGLEFFERVEDRKGEGVLVEGGKVVKEAPDAWRGVGLVGRRGR